LTGTSYYVFIVIWHEEGEVDNLQRPSVLEMRDCAKQSSRKGTTEYKYVASLLEVTLTRNSQKEKHNKNQLKI